MKNATFFLFCFCSSLLFSDQTKEVKKMLKNRSDLDNQTKAIEKELKNQTLLKGEGESLGKQANDQISHLLQNLYQKKDALTAFQNDLLSEKDKGATFDLEKAKTQVKSGMFPKASEVGSFVSQSWQKAEPKEEAESYLETAATIKNPGREIGILSNKTTRIPEETRLQTCREKGTYLKTIFQTLRVHIDRKIIAKQKTCRGHTNWKTATYPFKWSAKDKEEDLKKQLNEHFNVMPSFTTKIQKISGRWQVEYFWKHLHPDQGDFIFTEKPWEQRCFSYDEHDVIEETERDEWRTNPQDLEELKYLAKECTLIQTDAYSPGENATTNSNNIWRDAWVKRLVFSCAPRENSPCEQLQHLGGTFVSKRCIEKDNEGNCRLIEKTYEMGGLKAAYTQETFHFHEIEGKEERIFGLEEFDRSYEKNASFGAVFAIYSALANAEAQIETGHLDPNQPLLFAGEPSSCCKYFSSKKVLDCCYQTSIEGRGLIIGAKLAQCNEEERNLCEKIAEKKCHPIGRYRKGIIERQVFCCFPTLLARIVQEQARKQLGESWGTPESPNCSGITLNDLKSLDFEKMNFSDFITSMQGEISSQDIARKVKQLTADFSKSNCYGKVQRQTETIVKEQQEQMQLGGQKQ